MKYWLLIQLLFIAVFSNNAFAQLGVNDTFREMEMQRLQMETQRLKMEADTTRMNADTARMNADTDRMMDRMMSERAAQEAAERAESAAAEQAETARKAEETSDELRDEIARAQVKTSNTLYLAGLAIGLAVPMAFVIKRKRRNIPMQENEKFGLVTIIISFLTATLALMMSVDWLHQFDFLTNLMTTLKIQLIVDESDGKYFIDFSTKYFLLVCLSIASYGVTTYLNITPVPWKKNILSAAQ